MSEIIMLSHEETQELIKLAQNDDEGAKAKLITHNTPLIKSIIKRYKNKGIEYDDLFQLGCMGLVKAIRNFDAQFDVRFSTYAVPMIIGEIKRFLRDDGYIKISRAIKSLAIKINSYLDEARKTNEREPTIKQLAEVFCTTEEEIVFAMDASRQPISIFEKVDESSENSQNVLDKIVIADNSEKMINYIDLKNVIATLKERERKIIMLRFYRDKTQSEVAKQLGVSQVQVSRLESKILATLKEKLE